MQLAFSYTAHLDVLVCLKVHELDAEPIGDVAFLFGGALFNQIHLRSVVVVDNFALLCLFLVRNTISFAEDAVEGFESLHPSLRNKLAEDVLFNHVIVEVHQGNRDGDPLVYVLLR